RALSAREFTYELPDGAGKGAVVSMPFGRSRARGVVVDVVDAAPPGVKPVPVEKVVHELPPSLVDLALWLAEYYGSTPARALALVAPPKPGRRGEGKAPRRAYAFGGEPAPAELGEPERGALRRLAAAADAGGGLSPL